MGNPAPGPATWNPLGRRAGERSESVAPESADVSFDASEIEGFGGQDAGSAPAPASSGKGMPDLSLLYRDSPPPQPFYSSTAPSPSQDRFSQQEPAAAFNADAILADLGYPLPSDSPGSQFTGLQHGEFTPNSLDDIEAFAAELAASVNGPAMIRHENLREIMEAAGLGGPAASGGVIPTQSVSSPAPAFPRSRTQSHTRTQSHPRAQSQTRQPVSQAARAQGKLPQVGPAFGRANRRSTSFSTDFSSLVGGVGAIGGAVPISRAATDFLYNPVHAQHPISPTTLAMPTFPVVQNLTLSAHNLPGFTAADLPELNLLLTLYFDNVAPHFEFIHRSSFLNSLESHPQHLLDSMCALAIPFLPPTSQYNRTTLPKSLFQRASTTLMSIEPLPRHISAAWTFIHLALYALLHESSVQRALALAHGFHAMASSTAHSLRKAAHMRGKPPPSRDWVESEQRRRTWFSVWILGTVLEAASGQRQSSAYVDQLLPLPCLDPVWRRSRGKREAEERASPVEEESLFDPGMFVDLELFGENEFPDDFFDFANGGLLSGLLRQQESGTGSVHSPGSVEDESRSTRSSGSSQRRRESFLTYTRPFPSLPTEDLPVALQAYFNPDAPPFPSPTGQTPTPPHNAFRAIVELHALLEHAMCVAKGERKRDMGKEEVERALLRWESMWEARKSEVSAKVWFGGMIMLRTALGLVNGIPSAYFRRESLRMARLLAPLSDQQLLHIGPPYACLSVHSAGLALIGLLDMESPGELLHPQRGIEVCLNFCRLHGTRWPLARVLAASLEDALRKWSTDKGEEFLWTGLGSLDLGEEVVGGSDDERAEQMGQRKKVAGGLRWGTVEVKVEDPNANFS